MIKFGRFIRKTKIDELSELFNMLKDDMSIARPRPLLVEYLKC
ncbi:sugar transferase [uncultured Succiniclasticum sp.]